MSKKILIIEDTLDDFETIRNEFIRNKKSVKSDIFPRSNFADFTLNLKYKQIDLLKYKNEFSFMLDLYKEINDQNINELFEFIFSSFKDIDYYIVDVNLTTQDNKEGIEFYKFLLNKGIDANNIYIVTPKKINNLDIDIDDSHFILKDSAGEFGSTLSGI